MTYLTDQQVREAHDSIKGWGEAATPGHGSINHGSPRKRAAAVAIAKTPLSDPLPPGRLSEKGGSVSLRDLCASVFDFFLSNFTTEAQRLRRVAQRKSGGGLI